MSAQFAKDDVSFFAPAGFSAVAPSVYAPAHGGALPTWLRSATKWFESVVQRRAAMDELGMLSDRELADIGLTRGDIPHLFDRPTVEANSTPGADRR